MVGSEIRQSHRWGFACCEDCVSAMVLVLVFVLIPGAVALGLLGRLLWDEAQPYADRTLTPAPACQALETEGRRRAEARRADLLARRRISTGGWPPGWTIRSCAAVGLLWNGSWPKRRAAAGWPAGGSGTTASSVRGMASAV